MKKLTLMTLILFLAAAVPAMAEGQCPRGMDCPKSHDCGGDKESPCPIVAKLMKKAKFFLANAEAIGLTDEQIQQIKAIKVDAEKDEILGGAQMQVAFLELESKMSADPVDLEAINKTVDELSAGMSKGAKKSAQRYVDLKSILTVEQKKKAKEIWKK